MLTVHQTILFWKQRRRQFVSICHLLFCLRRCSRYTGKLLVAPRQAAIYYSLNSNGPGQYKSFAHIRVEHRTAAVGQESLVNQPPVLDSVSVCFSPRAALLGTLRNYDGDGKENVKKGIGLIRKTTTLHVHHAFLYISLLSLHNYDVKWPNFKITWVRERQGDKFYHLCLISGAVPSRQLQPKFPSYK